MKEKFKPYYPQPSKDRKSYLKRFISGRNSWLDIIFEKSYSMKMGKVKIFGNNFFVPNEPDLVQRVMVKESKDFPKHEVLGEVLEPALGNSIFTTNGEEWQRQRKMMDKGFAHTKLKRVFPLMSNSVSDMMDRFDKYSEQDFIHIDAEMTHITADVIFRTILSEELKEEDCQILFDAFTEFQEKAQKTMIFKLAKLPAFWHKWRSRKSAKKIKAILAPIIKKRYDAFQSGDDMGKDDILSSIMQAKDPKTGAAFDYDELVDHISMLFLAGHETTASSLTWAIHLIANCPDFQEVIYKEIMEVVGDREIEYSDIQKLKQISNAFNEALRLFPPVGFFLRKNIHDTCMRDKNMKKNSYVVIAPWLIHRNRKQWQDADTFNPDRFDKETGEKEAVKCSYLPFGKGPRICIGKGFALQESSLILATLVKKYKFTPKPNHTPEPVGRITIRPENGVYVSMVERV